MVLKDCPSCKEQISKDAIDCPHCGHNVIQAGLSGKWGQMMAVLMIIIFVVFFISMFL